jgi:glycerol-3-phosphate O-acyltransferase / dihydroxyacetone phosphate acyltransferase
VRDFLTFINPQPLFFWQLSLTRRNLRCTAVPVVRAGDDAKPGSGLIYVREDSPTVLRGVGTKFTTELAPRKQVMLGKSVNNAAAEIVEIVSDTEARLKKEFGGESGKGTGKFLDTLAERNVEGLEYKILPFVDQAEMYGAVYARLKEGGCIGIFPEGTASFA